MRTLTAGELAALQGRHRATSARVLVEDAASIFRDLSALSGRNWIHGIEWGATIDDATASATVTLQREIYGTSLSTLADDSPLNVGGPLVDVGRELVIDVATSSSGFAPGVWRRVFAGEVDASDLASGSTVSLSCRDRGGVLLDAQIEVAREYGSEAGVPLQTVMQQLLDDTLGAGVVTLYVPVAPTFLITPYTQEPGSLLEALQGLAALIGWIVRYEWSDASGDDELTLLEPDRTKSVADWTFARSDYLRVTRLAVSRDRIRNVIRLEYQDAATGQAAHVQVEDAASIAKYGRRFMRLVEVASPIDTQAEALAMANAALLDLADPLAELEAELLYFWPIELGDLVEFAAKPGCFDTAQTLAVVGARHSLSEGKRRTTLTLRGRPAGAYSAWLRREVRILGQGAVELPGYATEDYADDRAAASETPLAIITPLLETDTQVLLQYDGVPGVGEKGTLQWSRNLQAGAPDAWSAWVDYDPDLPPNEVVDRSGFWPRQVQLRISGSNGKIGTALYWVAADGGGVIQPPADPADAGGGWIPTTAPIGGIGGRNVGDVDADAQAGAAADDDLTGMQTGGAINRTTGRLLAIDRSGTQVAGSGLFQRLVDSAADVVEDSARGFVDPAYLDSRRPASVYRGGIKELAANLFKRASDTLDSVADSATYRRIGAAFSDASNRLTSIFRSGVTESADNLFKKSVDTFSSIGGSADWSTQISGTGKPANNADVTGANQSKGLLVADNRGVDTPPAGYAQGTWQEFKQRSVIGAPGIAEFGALETVIPWVDASGGYATQTFRSSDGVFKRSAPVGAASWDVWQTVWDEQNNPSKVDRNGIAAELVDNLFKRNVDTLDVVAEGSTYKRTTANEKTGAGRGYTGLNDLGEAKVGVARGALIDGVDASLAARGGASAYVETFDTLPPGAPGSANIVSGAGVTGGNVMQVGGADVYWYSAAFIPFNPSPALVYRLRMRLRATNDDAAPHAFYAGIYGVDAARQQVGTSNGSGNMYVLAANRAITVAEGWLELEAWISGATGAGSNDPGAPFLPTPMPAGTVYIAPLLIANYQGIANQTMQVDTCAIEVMDAEAARRTYVAIEPGGDRLAPIPWRRGVGGVDIQPTNVFRHGTDTAAGVVEDSARGFVDPAYLDSRRPASVYRGGIKELAANLFKRASDTLDSVADSATYRRIGAAFSDASNRLTSIFRSGVTESADNLFKKSVDTFSSIGGSADWSTQISGTGKPANNADVTAANQSKGLLVVDQRVADTPPAGYAQGTWQEFQDRVVVGAPGTDPYGLLETHKPWVDSSATATQIFKSSDGTFRRTGGCGDAAWGPWERVWDEQNNPDKVDRAGVGTESVDNLFRTGDSADGVAETAGKSFTDPAYLDSRRPASVWRGGSKEIVDNLFKRNVDTLDSVAEGLTYRRTTANEKTGASRAYDRISDLGGVYVPQSESVHVGTQGSPSYLEKTIAFAAPLFHVTSNLWAFDLDDVRLATVGSGNVRAVGAVAVPVGATITQMSAMLYRATMGSVSEVKLSRVVGNSATPLANVAHASTGWTSLAAALSELVTAGNQYAVYATLFSDNAALYQAAVAWVTITYRVTNYSTGY